jgi:hypothetical protein
VLAEVVAALESFRAEVAAVVRLTVLVLVVDVVLQRHLRLASKTKRKAVCMKNSNKNSLNKLPRLPTFGLFRQISSRHFYDQQFAS